MPLWRRLYERFIGSAPSRRVLRVIRYRTGLGHQVEDLARRVGHLEATRPATATPSSQVPTPSEGVSPHPRPNVAHDFSELDTAVWQRVRPYTMTSPERVYALLRAVEYVARSSIPGAFVECGVWKGGSMMAAAMTLLQLGSDERELYLFDTFEGMAAPGPLDVRYDGVRAVPGAYAKLEDAPLEEVRRAVLDTGYPSGRVHFVKGLVEETIPRQAPAGIALLRLDTDWYESTLHELKHLYPRLASGGVLIVDDYGWWRGARQAVDEYIHDNDLKLLLNRIDEGDELVGIRDSGCRLAVKP